MSFTNPYLTVPIALLALAIVSLFLRNVVHERFWLGATLIIFGGLLVFDLATTAPFMREQTYFTPDPVIDQPGWLYMMLYAMVPTIVTVAAGIEIHRLITGQTRVLWLLAIMPLVAMDVGAALAGTVLSYTLGQYSYLDGTSAFISYGLGHAVVLFCAFVAWTRLDYETSIQSERNWRLLTT
jgi:hypothetical protein